MIFVGYLPTQMEDHSENDVQKLWSWASTKPHFLAGVRNYSREEQINVLRKAYSLTLTKYVSTMKTDSSTKFTLRSFFPLEKLLTPSLTKSLPPEALHGPEPVSLILTAILMALLQMENAGHHFVIFHPPSLDTLHSIEIHRKIAEKRKGFLDALMKTCLVPSCENFSVCLSMLTIVRNTKEIVLLWLDFFNDLSIEKVLSEQERKLVTFYWQIKL